MSEMHSTGDHRRNGLNRAGDVGSARAASTAPIRTVAIMSPGDMGHAVGNVLRHGGLRVITNLAGRSRRTAALAAEAGIADAGDDETLVTQADAILAILVPAEAVRLAERLAASIRRTGARPLYVDCNAIAPQTARRIGEIILAAGTRFVDAGIIGGPPRVNQRGPRFYASGEDAAAFAQLARHGLDVRLLGPVAGHASGLKMCYAACTKGLTALATELLVAGRALGVSAALEAELRASQGTLHAQLERGIPGMPPKAYRWVGEMEEIAATFEALGLTPRMLAGAADLYRFVEQTPLGQETPEQRRRGQTLDDVIDILAASLPAGATGRSASGSSG
jgi:3-hydroxyisobutyrate dehydrogenase-like beta-hydroxyacid dehydrogenase